MDEGSSKEPLLKLIKVEGFADYEIILPERDSNSEDFYESFHFKVENLDHVIENASENGEQVNEGYRHKDEQEDSEDDGEIYPCIMCDYQSASLEDVTKHLSTHDKSDTFQCQFCDFRSDAKTDFDNHIKKHRIVKSIRSFQRSSPRLKCKECFFETNHAQSLKRHYLRHRAPKEDDLFRCYECDYTSRFKHNLKVHILLHANNKNYKARSSRESAPYYEKSFYNHYDYKFISNDKTKCLLCGYTSNCTNYVKKHMRRVHSEEMGVEFKVFRCFHCAFETKFKYSLQLHLYRVHQKGVVPLLTKHTSSSKKGDQYSCEVCNFKSYHFSEIEVHKLSHENIEHANVFKCKLCNFKSIYKVCVNRHELIHLPNKGKKIKCDMCKYAANRKDEMKAHMLRCHLIEKKKRKKT